MPTQKTPTPLYLVKINSDFSRFFDKETVYELREGERDDFNLILPDFQIKYKKTPWKYLTKALKEEMRDGYIYWGKSTDPRGWWSPRHYYRDNIIKNASSFESSNFWYTTRAEICPYNLHTGKLQAITTLKPLEFKKLFIERCEHYVQTYWGGRYRDCIIGDYNSHEGKFRDSTFSSFDRETGKIINSGIPPLNLESEGKWGVLNPGVKTEYIKKNQKFFHPKISLQIV